MSTAIGYDQAVTTDRPLPLLTTLNEPFWTGGAGAELLIVRCRTCRCYLHPPAPVCRRCRGVDVGPEPVSGRGVVHTFTVNHQAWYPDWEVPYVIAVIELAEQEGLRVTSNVIGCNHTEVRVGMEVRVVFEQQDQVWFPLFVPAGEVS